MFSASLLPFSVLALTLLNGVSAVRFPIVGKRTEHNARALVRRDTHTKGSAVLEHFPGSDFAYFTNIIIGGAEVTVQIDTGSTDLWAQLDEDEPFYGIGTGANGTLVYGSGNVTGIIGLARLEFAGHVIENQAFLAVPEETNFASVPGILGLGPNIGSSIFLALNTSGAAAPLDRIFRQDLNTANFITSFLDRTTDAVVEMPGELTIGEIIEGYEAVTDQVKLTVTTVQSDQEAQHWSTLMDEDGLLINGTAIKLPQSVVNNATQLTVVFDTGASLALVPKVISDAIYADIPGAQFGLVPAVGSEGWVIPCDTELNVSFVFGGQKYDINPLDLTIAPDPDFMDGKLCPAAFVPNDLGDGFSGFDMLLGDSFLRSVYMLINFGDFVNMSADTTADPYIQLLSLTNDTAAVHDNFVQTRINGTVSGGGVSSAFPSGSASVVLPSGSATAFPGSMTGFPSGSAALSSSQPEESGTSDHAGGMFRPGKPGQSNDITPQNDATTSSPTGQADSVKKAAGGLKKGVIIAIAVASAVGALVLIAGVALALAARKKKKNSSLKRLRSGEGLLGSSGEKAYRKLDEPAPGQSYGATGTAGSATLFADPYEDRPYDAAAQHAAPYEPARGVRH